MNRTAVAKELVKVARQVAAGDPADETYDYLMGKGSQDDLAQIRKLVDQLEKELADIRKQIAGLDKLGSGRIEAQSFLPHLRRALAPLLDYLGKIDANAKRFSR